MSEKPMMAFDITRKRTVSERFRVIAETEDEACRLIDQFDENPEEVELIEVSTHHSRLWIHGVEAIYENE